MLLQRPEFYEGLGYYEDISLILWIVSSILMYIGFILYTKKATEIEMKSQKMMFYAHGTFALCMGTVRIFFIIAFHNYDYYDFYTTLGYVIGIVGLIFWLYTLETYLIKKTKKIFTFISIIILGISLLSLFGAATRELALTLIWVLLPLATGLIIFLYIYLIFKTTGIVRKKVIWLLIGLAFIFIGHSMDSDAFVSIAPWFPLFIPPIILMVGSVLYIWSQLYYGENE